MRQNVQVRPPPNRYSKEKPLWIADYLQAGCHSCHPTRNKPDLTTQNYHVVTSVIPADKQMVMLVNWASLRDSS